MDILERIELFLLDEEYERPESESEKKTRQSKKRRDKEQRDWSDKEHKRQSANRKTRIARKKEHEANDAQLAAAEARAKV
jgi:hypothetical protein